MNKTNRLLLLIAPLGVALVALLLLLKGLSAPTPTPAPPTPTPDPAQKVVAQVGEQNITFADWALAFYLDTLMNRLSGQPIPTARETLDRAINDALILPAAAEEGIVVSKADVEARIGQLEAAWGLSDEQVAAELTALGLTREVWAGAISNLLIVERYLNEVVWADTPSEERANALAAWLQDRRAQAGVEVDTLGLQPALPTPAPGPTATPVAASPLPTPSPSPIPSPTATPAQPSPLPTPAPTGPPSVGQPAPNFALPDVAGQTVSLSDYRDQRRVVIVFFRTSG